MVPFQRKSETDTSQNLRKINKQQKNPVKCPKWNEQCKRESGILKNWKRERKRKQQREKETNWERWEVIKNKDLRKHRMKEKKDREKDREEELRPLLDIAGDMKMQ